MHRVSRVNGLEVEEGIRTPPRLEPPFENTHGAKLANLPGSWAAGAGTSRPCCFARHAIAAVLARS